MSRRFTITSGYLSRMRQLLAALTVMAALGCSGLGADPHALDPYCATQTTLVPPGVTLPNVDRPGVPLRPGATFAVTAGGVEERPSHVADEVAGPTLLYIDGGAPVERVLEALAAAPVATPVARSRERWSLPGYLSPAVADELAPQLGDPALRPAVLGRAMLDAAWLCPDLRRTISGAVVASPEVRCTILTKGLEESLPLCVATDGARVITLIQIAYTPVDPQMPALLEWDPAAEPLAVDRGAKWADVAPLLAANPASGLTLR